MIGSPDYLVSFVPYVKERLDLVRNPSFLGYIIGQIDIDFLENEYYALRVGSNDIEEKTGHGASFTHDNPGDLKQLDSLSMTKSVHALASSIANAECSVKTSLLRLERLAVFDEKLQDARSQENSLERDRNAQEMTQHAQWQVGVLKSMLYEYEKHTKAAASQMSIVRPEVLMHNRLWVSDLKYVDLQS